MKKIIQKTNALTIGAAQTSSSASFNGVNSNNSQAFTQVVYKKRKRKITIVREALPVLFKRHQKEFPKNQYLLPDWPRKLQYRRERKKKSKK